MNSPVMIVFLAVILFNFLVSFTRGFKKAALRLATALLSLLGALLITPMLSASVASDVLPGLEESMSSTPELAELMQASP